MPYKYDATGNIVTADVSGVKLPVFIHDDAKEVPFDAAHALGKITQLNGEAASHRTRAESAEAKVKVFTDAGLTDPAAAVAALKTVKNLDDKKLVDAGEVEKVKTEAVKAVEEKYAPVVKERDTFRAQLDDALKGQAFRSSKFVAEKIAAADPVAAAALAQALFGSQLRVEDGKLVCYDSVGNKIYSKAKPGNLADAEEGIELMVDAYPHKSSILKGSGASGGGASGGAGSGGGGGPDMSGLSPQARLTAARQAQQPVRK